MAEKKTKSYLSGKEIRTITKENKKVMSRLEKYKKRRAKEAEFTTQMKVTKKLLNTYNKHGRKT